jgi:4'-phosphopantetheinyl transferase
MLECLTVGERHAAERQRSHGGFARSARCRGALRAILARHMGQAVRAILIIEGKDTKPTLAHNPLGLHFNVSHSGDRALIALGRDQLGVDIEAVRPTFDWHSVVAHWFHAGERAILASAPRERRAEIFFQIWTLKEAYLKGVGSGSLDNMGSFFVPPEGGSVSEPATLHPRVWQLKPLMAPPGYKASIASANPAPIVIDYTRSFAEIVEFGE